MRLGHQLKIGGPVVMMQAAEPAVVVASGSDFEGGEIAVRRHATSLADQVGSTKSPRWGRGREVLSGSPRALLRRGPLRTSACGFHRTGLKQAHWVTGFRDAVKIR